MKDSVVDSYAILAFLFGERGSDRILARFERAAQESRPLLVAAINWAEVRYIVERKVGTRMWREACEKLLGLPLEVVPADRGLAEMAGEIKVVGKMSLADCFAAALAKQRKADLYTGDPEFVAVEKDIDIAWIHRPTSAR